MQTGSCVMKAFFENFKLHVLSLTSTTAEILMSWVKLNIFTERTCIMEIIRLKHLLLWFSFPIFCSLLFYVHFFLPQITNEIISNRHTFDLSIYFLLGRFLVVCSLVVCPRVVLSPWRPPLWIYNDTHHVCWVVVLALCVVDCVVVIHLYLRHFYFLFKKQKHNDRFS